MKQPKEMYCKYMIDSWPSWAEEFGVDGFRLTWACMMLLPWMPFVRPWMILILGFFYMVGWWDMGIGSVTGEGQEGYGPWCLEFDFNDNAKEVRGRGLWYINNGYVSGAPLEDQIAKSLLGSRGFVNYLMPGQVLNYIEAHDNYNLNDLIKYLHPPIHGRYWKRIYLANALNLSMQGMFTVGTRIPA